LAIFLPNNKSVSPESPRPVMMLMHQSITLTDFLVHTRSP
jgi:hypothetical protein